jgi:hypothetical protein
MIKKGEKVYDSEGKPIGEFTRDLTIGDYVSSSDFKYVDGTNPEPASPIQKEIEDHINGRIRKTKA